MAQPQECICNRGDAGNAGSIPGVGRSPGGRNGNLLQYSCWEIPRTEESDGLYSPWALKEWDMTEGVKHTHCTFERQLVY